MWITDIIRSKRWFFLSLTITLTIPGIVLAGMTYFAKEMTEDEALEVAAVAVKNYVDENPPRDGWKATAVSIDPAKQIIVDIAVTKFEQAMVIKTRNERIKFSYLKLACPPGDAWVYDWLDGKDRIWINLHHHGESLLKAPCPNSRSGIFS